MPTEKTKYSIQSANTMIPIISVNNNSFENYIYKECICQKMIDMICIFLEKGLNFLTKYESRQIK